MRTDDKSSCYFFYGSATHFELVQYALLSLELSLEDSNDRIHVEQSWDDAIIVYEKKFEKRASSMPRKVSGDDYSGGIEESSFLFSTAFRVQAPMR